MKICLISYHCCPFSLIGGNGVGGMNVYLKELSAHLTRLPGVEIDIFTRIKNQQFKRIRNISSSLRVIHLKGGEEHVFDRRDLYDFLPEFNRNLSGFILEEGLGYDVVYTHYWLSGLAGVWIKNRFSLPLVHTYHTLGFLKERALGCSEHRWRNYTESRLASRADIIISSSNEEKEHLNERYGISASKQRVISPGINKSLFYPVLPDRDIFKQAGWDEYTLNLLYVGRIEPVKGLMNIVESLAMFKQSAPALFRKLRLAVIGGGSLQEDFEKNQEARRIREFIRSKSLQRSIKFLGSKKQEELRRYYSAADALVVPSLYESFGLVVIEALACGIPVIVSKVGKMQSLIKEGRSGFLFKAGSPVSLCESLQQFLSARERLWDQYAIRRDVISRFSWMKTAEETYEVLSSLVNKAKLTTTLQPCENLRPAENFLLRPCP